MTGAPGDMTKTPDPVRKPGMDALSDVLRVAHLTGGVFLHADFFALARSTPGFDPAQPGRLFDAAPLFADMAQAWDQGMGLLSRLPAL